MAKKIEVGQNIRVRLHTGVVTDARVQRIGLEAANLWCMVEVRFQDHTSGYFPAKESEVLRGEG